MDSVQPAERIRCSNCGKGVSTPVVPLGSDGLIVRAWVECPECMEARPALIARAPEMAALLDEVRAVLESVEWVDRGGYEECPSCFRQTGMLRKDHLPDCRLSALLSRLKREEAGDER